MTHPKLLLFSRISSLYIIKHFFFAGLTGACPCSALRAPRPRFFAALRREIFHRTKSRFIYFALPYAFSSFFIAHRIRVRLTTERTVGNIKNQAADPVSLLHETVNPENFWRGGGVFQPPEQAFFQILPAATGFRAKISS